VVMDHLGSHTGRATTRCRSAHQLLLSAFNLDLNPIEQVFPKLKTLTRNSQPRGFEAT